MVLRKKLTDFFLWFIAASALVAPTASMAGDWHRHRHHDRYYQDYGGISGYGLPTHIPGLGTFAGNISGVHIRGVGNYFYIQPSTPRQSTKVYQLRPKAKVVSGTNRASCAMENGVCVIRP